MTPALSLRHYLGAYEPHSHDHAQLLWAEEGLLELELEGRTAFVDRACGLVIPAGVRHAFHSRSPARTWVVDLMAGPGVDRVRRFAAPRHLDMAIDSLVQQGVLDAPRVLARRAIDLQSLRDALGAALHRRWTAADMAALVHLSVPQFHARLAELTGSTPQALLRGLRLDRAEVLLRAGRSLDAVALQVGYATASALAAALRRERGLGARALRRR